MMNRISLLSFLISFCFLSVNADEQKKVTLDNEGKKETVELYFCNLAVSLDEVTEDGNAVVSVSIDNVSETNTLIVFDRAYDEKTLKKTAPSIRYDKIFPGSKGKRIIDYYPEIHNPFIVYPSQNEKVVTITRAADSVAVCRLPIYIAKQKGKKKLLLLEKVMVELDINFNVKANSEYQLISTECDNLIKSISRETFCKNRYHKGTSYNSLVKNYKSKIDNLKSRINKYISNHGYTPSAKGYTRMMALIQRLDAINFDEHAVSRCNRDGSGGGGGRVTPSSSGHSCNYCSMSYENIYSRMENYYIDIHNGKKTKSQVISDVRAMNTCIQQNTKRTANSSLKSRISKYINRIESSK